jgi:hypothetical protein
VRNDYFVLLMALAFGLLAPLSIWLPRRFHDQVAYLSVLLAMAAIGMAVLLAYHA